MGRLTGAVFLMFLLYGCRPCDEPVIIDYGKIPDSVLQWIPYQNGQVYRFRHSAGKVINFTADRQSRQELMDCGNHERCCDYLYKYEVNTTVLIPDYPVFKFEISMANMGGEIQSMGAFAGQNSFILPGRWTPFGQYDFADSVLINERYYYHVLKLKSDNYSDFYHYSIFADSMLFNFERGILQIKMSNGEKYSIYE